MRTRPRLKGPMILALFVASLFAVTILTVPALAQDESTVTSTLSEVDFLKTQLVQAEDFNRRILQTVYWSLGTLAVVFFALLGVSWYANFHLYERDKKALADEVQNLVKTKVGEATKTLTDQVEQATGTLTKQVEQATETLTKTMNEKAKAIRSSVESSMKGQISLLTNDLAYARAEIKEIEAQRWEAGGVLTNALRSYIAKAQIEMEHSLYGLEPSLDEIERLINIEATNMKGVGLTPALTALVNKLPEGLHVYGARIMTKLESM